MNVTDTEIKEALFRDFGMEDVTFVPLSGYYDKNFKVTTPKETFFLKVYGFDALPFVLFQLDVMERCVQAGFPVARLIKTKRDASYFVVGDKSASLQEFLPGIPVAEAPHDVELMEELGQVLGRMHRLISRQEFKGESWKKYPWDLSQFELVSGDYTQVRDSFPKQTVVLIDNVFAEWTKSSDILSMMRKGVVHNDYHAWNILVSGKKVSAITDFGDAMYSWYAGDVAIALAHLCFEELNSTDVFVGHFLRGYEREFVLDDMEKSNLPLLIQMRAVTAMVEIALDSQKLAHGMYTDIVRLQTGVLEFLAKKSLTHLFIK